MRRLALLAAATKAPRRDPRSLRRRKALRRARPSTSSHAPTCARRS
jgi:hypothetical protein